MQLTFSMLWPTQRRRPNHSGTVLICVVNVVCLHVTKQCGMILKDLECSSETH